MSAGLGEGVLAGVVVEVLKTCFAYGKERIKNYRNYAVYKAEDVDTMDETINKLLNIKDFYNEFWCHIPSRDRILLGKYLAQLHNLLCNNPAATELADALSPSVIYERLGHYMAAIEGPTAQTSSEDTTYVRGVWERTKREMDQFSEKMDKVSEKVRYAVKGRDQVKKTFELVGRWIDRIDDLIALRSNYLVLRTTLANKRITERVTQRVQEFSLPNTTNRIGMLLTNSDNVLPAPMENDTALNPRVTVFNSSVVNIFDSVDSFSQTLSTPAVLAPQLLGQSVSRKWATFSPASSTSSTRVIVEFKPVEQRDGFRGVKSLIKALHIGARDPDRVHVLDCLGLFEHTTASQSAIGIIFKVPFDNPDNVKCQTLNRLLSTEGALLSHRLGDRISVATSLAWSLSRFHMARWVHKRFCSDNILLFQDLTSGDQWDSITWSSPYLVGFDLARPNEAFSGPLNREPFQWSYKVYTHPDRLNNDSTKFVKFTKRHDIYSLGVVLLELGKLCAFTTSQYEKELSKFSPSDLHQCFREMAQTLTSNMGSVYAEVTMRCLDGDFGVDESEDDAEDTTLSEQFIVRVCERLECIHV